MKKILFLIHDLSYGGAEKVLVNLANHIDKTKYDVTVQTLFDVGVNKKFLNDDVHYIGGWKKLFRGNAILMKKFTPNQLCKFVIKDDYDIVISFLEGPCSRIVSAFGGKKLAWIHIEHSSVESLASTFRSIDEMQQCYNKFDKIVCVADTVKENFLKLSGATTNDCVTLYNVNDTDNIIKKAKESQNIISSGDDYINIISVGRLIIKHKGFERLINVHKRLLDNGVNNRLFILGDGPDLKKLNEQINALGVSDTCVLLGFDENPYKYISKADLFVCSSYKEGFSTAVTEALVLGVPVVSTEVSGARELLGSSNEFGIVTANDEYALYDDVYGILTQHGLLEHYRQQAEIRGQSFSAEVTARAVEDLLERI